MEYICDAVLTQKGKHRTWPLKTKGALAYNPEFDEYLFVCKDFEASLNNDLEVELSEFAKRAWQYKVVELDDDGWQRFSNHCQRIA